MSPTPPDPKPAGYHIRSIPKGTLGELSKIQEELEEAQDAEQQQSSIMVLVELSDMIGAVEAYLARHHPSVSLEDLQTMAAITRRAFASGRRQEATRTVAPPRGREGCILAPREVHSTA